MSRQASYQETYPGRAALKRDAACYVPWRTCHDSGDVHL
jgi:hypothetical protein